MHQNKILIATTFRLGEIEKVAPNIKRWRSQEGTSVLALIEENELYNNLTAARLLQKTTDKISTYSKGLNSTFGTISSKSPPSLIDVIRALRREKDFIYYSYVNADIEFLPNFDGSILYRKIDDLSKGEKIVFAHRRDYEFDPATSECYTQGLDFFTIPRKIMKTITPSPALNLFQVGQVGWDYMFPLHLPASQVVTTCTLPIYHKKHTTGSDADWSYAIASCLPHIHTSWTDGKPMKRLILKITARSINMFRRNQHSLSKGHGIFSKIFYYYISRFVFYGIINHVLLRNGKT